MVKSQSFEKQYPAIAYFVEAMGWIEMGTDENSSAFVRAYDNGGTVYEGEENYSSLEDALEDLEAAIQDYLDENGVDEEDPEE
jgi:hypothetical protein